MEASVKVKGIEAVAAAFEELGRTLAVRVGRKAVGRAAKPIAASMRANLKKHKRTGKLAKSIGTRVKSYGHSGTIWAGVGVRSGHKQNVTLPDGRRVFINPRKYAHLVEKGTYRTKAYSFMLKAFESNAKLTVTRLTREIKIGLDREIARVRARNRSKG